jgi:hypothetical protein
VRAESFLGSYFEKNCHFFQQKTPNKRNKNGTFHHQKRQFWKELSSFLSSKAPIYIWQEWRKFINNLIIS